MTRYLVTGAQGFVGRYFISHLLTSETDAVVVGLGRSPREDRTFTHRISCAGQSVPAPVPEEARISDAERYEYAALDVTDAAKLAGLMRAFRPDVIVHLASGLRDDEPSSLWKNNVDATNRMLEAATEVNGLKRIILGSTGGVYGVPSVLPISEDAACRPVDPYCKTKLAAEQASRTLARKYGLPVAWARLFNLVGPGQDERHICGRLAAQAAAIAGGEMPGVMSVGPLDTTRDFIDVRDVAVALSLMCKWSEPGAVYNVASGLETPMQSVLSMILGAAGLPYVRLEREPPRAADIPRHFACIDRLQSLGFRCRYALRRSLHDLVDYYRSGVAVISAYGRSRSA